MSQRPGIVQPSRVEMMGRRVIVIGGGVGGLAAAIRLGTKGCAVTLLEKNANIGGKLNKSTLVAPTGEAFMFDTGPSLLTMPFVFEQLFDAGGANLHDRLRLIPLDPISRFTWPDGQTFTLHQDMNATLDSVRRLAPGDVDGFRRFIDKGRRIWELAGDLFLQNSPEQLLSRKLSPRQGLAMLTVPLRIGMFGRYAKLVNRFVKHPKLRAILYQYATYSGASPWKAPATLAVIPYVEMHFGGWYIEGGMYKLANELGRLATENGVHIRTNAPVRRIRTDKRQVTGVELESGEVIDAEVVVCNGDVISSYRDLIDPADRPGWPDSKLDALDPGGSGMVLLLGIRGRLPQLVHHEKFMPLDYLADGGDLRAMFDHQTLPSDPCIYTCATSRTDPTQAPPDCENLFILVSAPPLHGRGAKIDWETEAPHYRDRVISLLENKFGFTDLSSRIIAEDRWTPRDLQERYRANAGSIYGIGSNSRLQAFLRPPNRDKHLSGLYFAGGATHPGGGLPLVALSGKIASELVLADLAAQV